MSDLDESISPASGSSQRRPAWGLAVGLLVGFLAASYAGLRIGWGLVGDGFFNLHVVERPAPLDELGRQRQAARFVADWHADSLLWGRRLTELSSDGHWDLPRARRGGLDLQMLTVVSETPEPLWLLGIAQGWPLAAAWDPARRIDWQIGRFERLVAAAPDVVAVTDRGSLERVAAGDALGLMLGLEGIHGIEGRPQALDAWYGRGVRMASLVHRHDNAYGSSSGGSNRSGPDALTPAGRDMLQRMRELGIILDVAHAAPGLIDEALEIYARGPAAAGAGATAERSRDPRAAPAVRAADSDGGTGQGATPIVVSHIGLRAQCDWERNLSDDQVRQIAAAGGLLGIMFAPITLCGDRVEDLVEAVRVTVELAGEDQVAFGSDWDGYVPAVVDVAELPELMAAMERAGMPERVVRKVAGENTLRFLRRWLPEGSPNVP